MDLYTKTSYRLAGEMTRRYSTSFSLSSTLFPAQLRQHIYAVYGLVRIADEIVDTYKGVDAKEQLAALEAEVMHACSMHYSVNPLVHAFADTANRYGIDRTLIRPFFESMTSDIDKTIYTQAEYEQYIYGSADVVGLMCLRVFVAGDEERYQALAPGAKALGSAYQKVNFLRDLAADYQQLGRVYFPDVDPEQFSETDKQRIVADIEHDFHRAKTSIAQLPWQARRAVKASVYYYEALLRSLKHTPAARIAEQRVRVADWRKIALLVRAGVGL
ncbi:MAG TPA: squalene/phytoene synthase family protein [Patescibacteria group bacterium]|nr:squalene/phytoene synthase family protein [Patescibacteria group bacterium]